MDPGDAERRFSERLEEAALPPFVSAEHDTELDLLKLTWAHGVTLYMDLMRDDLVQTIDAHGRAVILGLRPCCGECAPAIDAYVPRFLGDPRTDASIPNSRPAGSAASPGRRHYRRRPR